MKLRYRKAVYIVEDTWSHQTNIFKAFDLYDRDGRLLAANTATGFLTVYRGFAWDGASGPTFDGPELFGKSSRRATCAHDVYYLACRAGLLDEKRWRAAIDDTMYNLCREDGMFLLRAKLWRWGVGTFAEYAAKRGELYPVYTAGR